jgi:Cu/Ag efflux protein CusF
MSKMTFPALAAALFVAPALAAAQSPSPSPSPAPTQAPAPSTAEPRAQKAQTAKGELVKVDADAKTITIKGADGVETEFAYTATTDVPGASEGVSGLATKSGSKVTVHYTTDMGKKTVTKIEVAGDKKTS